MDCQLFEMKINLRPLIFPCSVVDWGEGLECTRVGFVQEVRRVKMLALETEEVHWCALVLMAGWSLLVLSVGVWAVGRKACLVCTQISLIMSTGFGTQL